MPTLTVVPDWTIRAAPLLTDTVPLVRPKLILPPVEPSEAVCKVEPDPQVKLPVTLVPLLMKFKLRPPLGPAAGLSGSYVSACMVDELPIVISPAMFAETGVELKIAPAPDAVLVADP